MADMLLRLILCVTVTIPTTLAATPPADTCDEETLCCEPGNLVYPEPIASMIVIGLVTSIAMCWCVPHYRMSASIGPPVKEMKSLVYQHRFIYKQKLYEPGALIHFSPVAGEPGHLVGSGTDRIGDFNLSLIILSDGRVRGTKIYVYGTGEEKGNHGQTVDLYLNILTHWSPSRCPGLFGTYHDDRAEEGEFQLIPESQLSQKLAKSLKNAYKRYFHPLRLLAVGFCVTSLVLTIVGGVTETTYTPGGGGIWGAAVMIVLTLMPNWNGRAVFTSTYAGTAITCAVVYLQLTAVGIIEDPDNCGVAGDGGLFATYCTDEADQGCVVLKHWRGQCDHRNDTASPICVGMSEDLYEDLDATVALIRAQVYLLLCGLLVLCYYYRARDPGHLPEFLPKIDTLVQLMKQTPDYKRLVSELMEAAYGDAWMPVAGDTAGDVEEGGGMGVQQQQESDVASTSAIPVAMGIPLLAVGGGGEGVMRGRVCGHSQGDSPPPPPPLTTSDYYFSPMPTLLPQTPPGGGGGVLFLLFSTSY